MHTKQLDFFFHSPIKGKVLLTSWKKLGTHKYYHYTGVKMGTKRERKKNLPWTFAFVVANQYLLK